MPKLILKLEVKVCYKTNNVDPQTLGLLLKNIVDEAYKNGEITGSTDAEVEFIHRSVSELKKGD